MSTNGPTGATQPFNPSDADEPARLDGDRDSINYETVLAATPILATKPIPEAQLDKTRLASNSRTRWAAGPRGR